MKIKSLALIGAGNIALSIADGLLESSYNLDIRLSRRNSKSIESYKSKAVKVYQDNLKACEGADLIIICVQPQQIEAVALEIKNYVDQCEHKPIVASVATNVSLDVMYSFFKMDDLPLVRIMPNTAIAVKESMTCMSQRQCSEQQQEDLLALFNELGLALFINDQHMNAATVLCACGVAFALRFVRAASQGGTEIGFHAEDAMKMAAQTVKGAASLVGKNQSHPESEIDKVTTPMGCTIAGLNEMEHAGFSSAAIKGIRTSFKRACGIKH